MRQSKLFGKTIKKTPKDTKSASHLFLIKGGFIDQLMAGVFTFLPLGFRVLKKIEGIIRRAMIESPVGAQEILMPALNPKENWQRTGRWQSFDVLFKLKGKYGKEYTLAPTHEEVVSPLVKKFVFSYKDLPLALFHIQTKFRNELRAKSGILRTREFIMKDLYSFHATEKDLDNYYERVKRVYFKIYNECGIGKFTYLTLAPGGTFSKYSHEFQTVTKAGEDIIHICQKCNLAINDSIKRNNPTCPKCGSSSFRKEKSIEVGNIFKLGTKYSEPFDLFFIDKDGKKKFVFMGCYGIGLGRLMGSIVEVNHDKKGIVWPKKVAPFLVHLIQIGKDQKIKNVSEKLYKDLQKEKLEVLYDDRTNVSGGEKLVESDLLGIPYRIVVSERTLQKNCLEIKERSKDKSRLANLKEISSIFKKLAKLC